MSEEFKKLGENTVTSSKGFTVEVKTAGGVLYRDGDSEVHIDSEWLVKPFRILLYKTSPEDRGLAKMEQARADAVILNVTRALQHLGQQVEIWCH